MIYILTFISWSLTISTVAIDPVFDHKDPMHSMENYYETVDLYKHLQHKGTDII